MQIFQYQNALITGASSGIGKAFAYELAEKGVNLVLTARSKNILEEIASDIRKKFNVKTLCIAADLTEVNAPNKIFEEINKKGIFIDLLINNAGFGKWANFLDESLENYQEMIALNITSLTSLTYLFAPKMAEKKRGGIINIASIVALQPCPYIAVYAASKAFVLSFSEALHGEFYDKGIVVTSVCPGNTDTNFQKVANADMKGMPSDTPKSVAQQGINSLLKKKSNKIIGLKNYLQSLLPRILPRKVVIHIVKNMLRKNLKS